MKETFVSFPPTNSRIRRVIVVCRKSKKRHEGDLQWHYYISGDSKVDVRGPRTQICGDMNVFFLSGREVN
jgi:hypothetical protein